MTLVAISKKNISKKSIVQKIMILTALYICFTSILISVSLPEDIVTSSVEKIRQFINILGGIGASYLVLVVIFSNSFEKLFVHIIRISATLILYFLFHFYLLIMHTLNSQPFKDIVKTVFDSKDGENFDLVLIITVFFIFVSILKEIKNFGSSSSSKREEKLSVNIYACFFILLLASDKFVSKLIFDLQFAPLDSGKSFRYFIPEEFGNVDLFHLYCGVSFVFILVAIVVFALFYGFSNFMNNKNSLSLDFSASLLLAMVFNYSIQRSMVLNKSGIVPVVGSTMFQVFILMLFFFALYSIINRFIPTTVFIVIVCSIYSIANGVKFSMRGEPIYVSEFSWLKNPKLILSFVNLKIVMLALFVILIVVLVTTFLSKRFFKNKITSLKLRIGTIAVIVVMFGIISQNFKNFTTPEERIKIPLVTNFLDMSNGDILWRGLPITARYKSQIFINLRQYFGEIMDKPENYNQETIKKVAKKYEKIAAEMNESRTENIGDQTVIFILSESLANPARIDGIELSKNPLANIDSIKETATGGLMYSNGYGGGTANMEIQSLTSLPMINFSTNVSIINSDVIPKMNYIPSISNQFQYRVAIHPENAGNYNRDSIYKKLGFQHFYALYGTSKSKSDTLTNQKLLNGKVSDEQTYEDILERIDTQKNQFFSVLTMQNHMPYDGQYIHDPDLSVTGKDYDEGTNQLLSDYTQKISMTDQTTKQFLEKLQQLDKKISVVFYGDHLPGLYPVEKAFASNPLKQYETDYFIWNNQMNKINKQQNVNSAEFVPLLLETQNAKVSPYHALTTEIMNQLPSEYNSVLGNSVKLNGKQKDLLSDLKLIQYDLTQGKGYLNDSKTFYQFPK